MSTATATAALTTERWLDEVVLTAQFSNDDGDHDLSIAPPAGIGDLAIMEMAIEASQIATMMTSPEIAGPRVYVVTSAGNIADILGTARWTRTFTLRLSAYISPDPLVLWRQGELLKFNAVEVDTNASPTVDFAVYVKCVRVRPVESAPGPIRLVR